MAVKFVSVLLSLLIAVTSTYALGLQGGVASSSTAHPYYVSIEDAAGEPICGGALISKDLVLSSSLCLTNYNAKQLFARVGNGDVIAISGYYYDVPVGLTVENDIGLIKLAKPITESSTTSVIKVPSSNTNSGTFGEIVAMDTYDRLAEAPVTIISAAECRKYKGKMGVRSGDEVCALSRSGYACGMQSGSPLVANDQLVGVVSWAYGCAQKGAPIVAMNVAGFKSWIESASKKV